AITAIGLHQNTDLRDKLTALNEKGRWQSLPLIDSAKTVKALMVPNPTARLTAVLALGCLGPQAKDALPVLKALQKDSDNAVRAGAILAVSAIAKSKTDWAGVDDTIKDAILEQKGSKDAGDLVRLHILFSVIPSFAREAGEPDPAVQESLNKNKEWTRT